MRRELNWTEPNAEGKKEFTTHHEDEGQSHPAGPNIEEVFEIGAGGCNTATIFIREVLRCMNVPVAAGGELISYKTIGEELESDEDYSGHWTVLARLDDEDYTIWMNSDSIIRLPYGYAPASLVILPMAEYMQLVYWWLDPAEPNGPGQVIKLFMKEFLEEWLVMWATGDPTLALGLFEGFFMRYAQDHACPQWLAYVVGSMGEYPSVWFEYLNLPLVPGDDDLLMNDPSLKPKIENIFKVFCDVKALNKSEGDLVELEGFLEDEGLDAETKAMYEAEKILLEGAIAVYGCQVGEICVKDEPGFGYFVCVKVD
jgi:hypothetical protein